MCAFFQRVLQSAVTAILEIPHSLDVNLELSLMVPDKVERYVKTAKWIWIVWQFHHKSPIFLKARGWSFIHPPPPPLSYAHAKVSPKIAISLMFTSWASWPMTTKSRIYYLSNVVPILYLVDLRIETFAILWLFRSSVKLYPVNIQYDLSKADTCGPNIFSALDRCPLWRGSLRLA